MSSTLRSIMARVCRLACLILNACDSAMQFLAGVIIVGTIIAWWLTA